MTTFRSRTTVRAVAVLVTVAATITALSLEAAADPAGPAIPKTVPTAPTIARQPKPRIARSKAPSKSKSSSGTVSTNYGPAAVGKNAGGYGQGTRGDKVLALQTRLRELKYDITSPDGKFGDETHHAVMAFQKVNGLARTGRANAATLAALETAVDPAPLVPTGGADRIEIDIVHQFLGLYRGGALIRLLSISSGSGKEFCVLDPDTKKTECDTALTPGGSFRVAHRILGWRESKLGLLYNPLYFNGGIAIHGAPSVPGYPASHGCVRIPMTSSQWFPDEVGDGTPVYVSGGAKAPVPLNAKAPTDAKAGSTTTTPAAASNGSASALPPLGATTLPPLGATTLPPLGATTLPPLGATVPPSAPGTSAPVPTSTSTTSTTTTTGLVRLLPPAPNTP